MCVLSPAQKIRHKMSSKMPTFSSTVEAENPSYCLYLTGVVLRLLISLHCSLLVYSIVVVSSTIANWGKLEYSLFKWGHLQNWFLDCCYKSKSTSSLQQLLLSRILSTYQLVPWLYGGAILGLHVTTSLYVQDWTLMRFKFLMINITECPYW